MVKVHMTFSIDEDIRHSVHGKKLADRSFNVSEVVNSFLRCYLDEELDINKPVDEVVKKIEDMKEQKRQLEQALGIEQIKYKKTVDKLAKEKAEKREKGIMMIRTMEANK